jgi:hypothetical protein
MEYYKQTLTVLYHNGMSNDPAAYEICSRIENVQLPPAGYYGISAATGGLADDHDVLSFVTHSLIEHNLQVSLKCSNPGFFCFFSCLFESLYLFVCDRMQ